MEALKEALKELFLTPEAFLVARGFEIAMTIRVVRKDRRTEGMSVKDRRTEGLNE